MSAEECRACAADGPFNVDPDESLPLCNGHWNAWLARFLCLYPGHEPEPAPCGAHLIQDAA